MHEAKKTMAAMNSPGHVQLLAGTWGSSEFEWNSCDFEYLFQCFK